MHLDAGEQYARQHTFFYCHERNEDHFLVPITFLLSCSLTRCRLTQESGMRVGVSNAGIRRSAKSTAARSSPPSYPATQQMQMA